jgi:hypothetical protein
VIIIITKQSRLVVCGWRELFYYYTALWWSSVCLSLHFLMIDFAVKNQFSGLPLCHHPFQQTYSLQIDREIDLWEEAEARAGRGVNYWGL